MITLKEHQWNGEPNLCEMLLHLVNFTCSAERRKQSLAKCAVQLQQVDSFYWHPSPFRLAADEAVVPAQWDWWWKVGLLPSLVSGFCLGMILLVCWWVVSLVCGTTWLPRGAWVLVCLAKLDHFCPQKLVCHIVCHGGGCVFGLILCDVSIRL